MLVIPAQAGMTMKNLCLDNGCRMPAMAAFAILLVHFAIIAFNIAGCVVVPIGAWRRWRWVRGFWWRLAHLLSFAVVAAQALAGRACFLTVWQGDLAGRAHVRPMIAGWINHLIYWPLPLWVFALAYVALFAYVLALWALVRPRWRR
jgi:hypothetical protein